MQKSARKLYNYQLKSAVIESNDPSLVVEFGGNPNTARRWKYREQPTVVGSSELSANPFILKRRIDALEKKVKSLESMIKLQKNVSKIVDVSLKGKQVRDREDRKKILAEIKKASENSKVTDLIEFIGLSLSRYKRWKVVEKPCTRTNAPHCLRRYPSQLTPEELSTMEELVTSPSYSHMRIRELHYHAKRTGALYCSDNTWYKYIDMFGWQRPRQKIPKKKKHKKGIRALFPNQIWHIDITEIKIQNGRTYYLQAIRDNYSRHILAWSIFSSKSGAKTVKLIKEAKRNARSMLKKARNTILISDGGPENVNHEVYDLMQSDAGIETLIAGVDIKCTNAMIEMFWFALKHHHLYFLRIETLAQLKKEVAFYIEQHNDVIPRSAHNGGTPREVFLGEWTKKREIEIATKGKIAKKVRVATNSEPCCLLS